jgi:hypothetical protein
MLLNTMNVNGKLDVTLLCRCYSLLHIIIVIKIAMTYDLVMLFVNSILNKGMLTGMHAFLHLLSVDVAKT